jgi:hypothetical protein
MIFFHRYIDNHYYLKLNQTPNNEYLGHPINAFQFIQHIATGWYFVTEHALNNDPWWKENMGTLFWNNVANDVGMCF